MIAFNILMQYRMLTHDINEYTRNVPGRGVQYQKHRCKQKQRRMLESCRRDRKEVIIYIDIKYGLIKFINLYNDF